MMAIELFSPFFSTLLFTLAVFIPVTLFASGISRKVVGDIQARVGPSRTPFAGVFQDWVDFFKELQNFSPRDQEYKKRSLTLWLVFFLVLVCPSLADGVQIPGDTRALLFLCALFTSKVLLDYLSSLVGALSTFRFLTSARSALFSAPSLSLFVLSLIVLSHGFSNAVELDMAQKIIGVLLALSVFFSFWLGLQGFFSRSFFSEKYTYGDTTPGYPFVFEVVLSFLAVSLSFSLLLNAKQTENSFEWDTHFAFQVFCLMCSVCLGVLSRWVSNVLPGYSVTASLDVKLRVFFPISLCLLFLCVIWAVF